MDTKNENVPKLVELGIIELVQKEYPAEQQTVCGMKSWGLKDITFRTDTMIINSTNLRKTAYAPIFYTVCYAPFLFNFYGSI